MPEASAVPARTLAKMFALSLLNGSKAAKRERMFLGSNETFE